MTRMFARRASKLTSGASGDQVIFGLPLPSDTVVHDIRAKFSVLAGQILTKSQICGYAVEGWILPVLDPDAAATFDAIWDALVPKDTDVTTLDLDTVAADATPFWEPGEVDFTAVVDVGLRPKRIYHRHRYLDMVNGAVGLLDDAAPPTAHDWQPGEKFTFHRKSKLRVSQPSILVFAIASPAGDDTTVVLETALTEPNWFQIKYIDHTLERAMLSLFGLTEAGAETPFEEATVLLSNYLDPNFFEETGGQFISPSWEVLAELGVDLSVPGTMPKGRMITGGR